MKKIILFILILCDFTILYSQEKKDVANNIKTTHEKTGSNLYAIRYFDDDSKLFINYNNPIDGVYSKPWQGKVKITSRSGKAPIIIAKEILKPYSKTTSYLPISLIVHYDLNGDMISFELWVPTELDIPIKAIGKLENRLRMESKLKLTYDPNKIKYINYITVEEKF